MRPPPREPSRSDRIRSEVDAELRSHIEGTVTLLVDRGMSEEEARSEALRRFGDPVRYGRMLARRRRSRERRRTMTKGWRVVEEGARSAVKGLIRAPGFAAAVVGTLALGIGANASLFGVVDRLVLSPPKGIEDAERVQRLWARHTAESGEVGWRGTFTYPGYEAIRESGAFDQVAAHGAMSFEDAGGSTLGSGEDAVEVLTQMVSGNYFSTLGARPSLGRWILPSDDRLDATPVAVLSHDLWERRFGADEDVVGRRVHVDDLRYQIVGVAPPGFTGATLHPVEIWVPLVPTATAAFGEGWGDHMGYQILDLIARSGPGTADETAMDRAAAAYGSFRRASVEETGAFALRGSSLRGLISLDAEEGPTVRAEARVAWWLAGVALLVLLVACANVANLFLARTTRLRRELAVKLALGVGRGRVLARFGAEALILSLLAGGAALIVAGWAGRLVQGSLLPGIGWEGAFSPGRTFGFTGAVVLVTAGLTGVVPALATFRLAPGEALKERSRTFAGGAGRVGTVLVVLQTALSAVLLVGAGLFVTSFLNARDVDLGFEPDRVLTVEVERTEEAEVTRTALYRELSAALSAMPGVEATASYSTLPFSVSFGLPVHVPGMDTVPRNASGRTSINAVGADYFDVLGVRIAEGRSFRDSDVGGDEPVAVVNRTFADHVWEGDALGRCVRVGGSAADCARIIGVAEDHHVRALVEEARLMVWTPTDNGPLRGIGGLAIRTRGDPVAALPAVRAVAQRVNRGVRFADVRPLADRIAPEYRSWRLGASVFTALGLLGVLVASVGLYGMLAYEGARRRRETAIRVALGAGPGRVAGTVVGRAVLLAGTGALVGVGIAAAAGRWVAPLLFGVTPYDPGVLGGAASFLLLLALAAAIPVALRATTVDPVRAMRTE